MTRADVAGPGSPLSTSMAFTSGRPAPRTAPTLGHPGGDGHPVLLLAEPQVPVQEGGRPPVDVGPVGAQVVPGPLVGDQLATVADLGGQGTGVDRELVAD